MKAKLETSVGDAVSEVELPFADNYPLVVVDEAMRVYVQHKKFFDYIVYREHYAFFVQPPKSTPTESPYYAAQGARA